MGNIKTFKVQEWVVFGINTFKPPLRVSDALINEARIVHVVHGQSRLHAAKHSINLQDGDTVVMKSDNFVNNWQSNEESKYNQVIAFQLNTDFLKHLYQNKLPNWFSEGAKGPTNAALKVASHPLITTYFSGLKAYLDNSQLLTEEVVQVKIRELLALLIETDHSGSLRTLFGQLFSAADYSFQDVIQRNLFEDLSIEELAFLCGLSLSSFKRKFKGIYGSPPNKYITCKRLEKAQVLLKSSQLSISEIAYDCGFSDVGYFSKVFKKNYNILPSEWRK